MQKNGSNRGADLWNLTTHAKGPAVVIVVGSARALTRYLPETSLNDFARWMVTRMVPAFILHRERMSSSSAAEVIAAELIHRGRLTRFLARSRWQKDDFNERVRSAYCAVP